MINPYYIPENLGIHPASEHNQKKHERIMEVLKPMLEAFEVKDFKLFLGYSDYLVIEGQKIWLGGCDSIGAIYCTVLNYIWRKIYLDTHSLPPELAEEFNKHNTCMWEKD